MKQLLVVRHAKAEIGEGDDHSRAITEEGRQDAAKLGLNLRKAQFWPDLILVSTALRAQQTMEGIKIGMHFDEFKIQNAENLYQGRLYDVLKLIESVDDKVNKLMIVGHNPIFFELINFLGEEQVDHFDTCAACVLSFTMEHWKELELHKASLTMIELND